MAPGIRAFGRGQSEFDRGLSFFDAIYGFAITLLIANIDLPPAESWESFEALADSGLPQQILGFVLSFVVIAVFWRVNYLLTSRMTGIDGATLACNIVACGLVVFVPYTTQALSDPVVNELAIPVALYALNIALASLAQTTLYLVANRRGLIPPEPDRRGPLAVAEMVDALLVPAVFLASIPLAFAVSPGAARASWLALLVLKPLSGQFLKRLEAGATNPATEPAAT